MLKHIFAETVIGEVHLYLSRRGELMKKIFISKTFIISFVILLILFGTQLSTSATLINVIAVIVLSAIIASIVSLIINAFRKTKKAN